MTTGGPILSFPTHGTVRGTGADTGICLIPTGITGIGSPVPGITTSGIMTGATTTGTIHHTTIRGLCPEYGGYTLMDTDTVTMITITGITIIKRSPELKIRAGGNLRP